MYNQTQKECGLFVWPKQISSKANLVCECCLFAALLNFEKGLIVRGDWNKITYMKTDSKENIKQKNYFRSVLFGLVFQVLCFRHRYGLWELITVTQISYE